MSESNGDKKPTIDERLDRLVERHEALAESIELLRGSVSDLTAIVHAQTANLAEARERDRQYFLALSQSMISIADLLRGWGEGPGGEG